MAIFSWNGASNLDLKILGQSFDFRSDVLQVSDPSLAASQFDLVEVGTDLAIVKSRDATGAPLAAADVRYAYIPNMVVRQVGVDASDASQNIVLSNGGQLWVGQRDTDTVLDDSGNVVPLSQALQSVQVWGLGGADTISTGDAADRVYGNTGADSISGGAGNDSLYGGQENDTIRGGAGADNVAGDLGNDLIDGGDGSDILYGGAGNDVIETGTGNDTVFAGAGNDNLTINNSATGDKLIYMDKGQDNAQLIGTTGDHLVYLGDNNDTAYLESNAGDIAVWGQGGNDSIESQNFGADTLDGGDDNDYLAILDGSIGAKTMLGGDGNDDIVVEEFFGYRNLQPNTQVTVDGGGGNDDIFYARGLFIADANNGGSGSDEITFVGPTTLSLREQSIQNIETINFADVPEYIGSLFPGSGLGFFSDNVTFADGNNTSASGVTVNALDGNDTINASRESSSPYILNGGGGEDSLVGGAGADTLSGDGFSGSFNPKDISTLADVEDNEGVSIEDFLDDVVGFDPGDIDIEDLNSLDVFGFLEDLIPEFDAAQQDTLKGGGGADVFVLDFPVPNYGGFVFGTITDIPAGPTTVGFTGFTYNHQTGANAFQIDSFDIIEDFQIGVDKLAIDSSLFGIGGAQFINTSDGEAITEFNTIIVNSGDQFNSHTSWGGLGFLTEAGSDADLGDHPALVVVLSQELTGNTAAEIWWISDLEAWTGDAGAEPNVVTVAAPVAVLENITSQAQLEQLTAADFVFI